MTSPALYIEITDENLDFIEEQMIPENEIASMDCMALNPQIADQVNSSGHRPGIYELLIYKVNVEDKDVFLLFFEDGDWGGVDDFVEAASFYETEADAMAAMGAEYNDWLTRF